MGPSFVARHRRRGGLGHLTPEFVNPPDQCPAPRQVKLVLHPLDLNFGEKGFGVLGNKRAFLNPGAKSHRERGLGGRFAHPVYIARLRPLALPLRTIIALFKLVGPLM